MDILITALSEPNKKGLVQVKIQDRDKVKTSYLQRGNSGYADKNGNIFPLLPLLYKGDKIFEVRFERGQWVHGCANCWSGDLDKAPRREEEIICSFCRDIVNNYLNKKWA